MFCPGRFPAPVNGKIVIIGNAAGVGIAVRDTGRRCAVASGNDRSHHIKYFERTLHRGTCLASLGATAGCRLTVAAYLHWFTACPGAGKAALATLALFVLCWVWSSHAPLSMAAAGVSGGCAGHWPFGAHDQTLS
jgi:hypothetical protein